MFILAIVMVFFWPVVFQGKVLAPLDITESLLRPWSTSEKVDVHNAFTYDAISQYLPYDYSVYQSLQKDGYIGWNPYVHSGASIVENTMISPGDWHHHLYRFLPFWESWNLGIILQFTIAAFGMLVFLRQQRIPYSYALIGVVAFAFYSQNILWIYHRWILGAACWAPWILWSLLRAKERGRLIDPLSAVFIALAFRGGHLQTTLFVFLLVAIIAFHYAIPNIWEKKPLVALRTISPFVISGLLATLLSVDVLVETIPPLLEGNKSMLERGWITTLMGIPTLLTSIIPTVMGTPQSLDTMKVFGSDLFSIKFMGGIALLLGIAALCNKRAPRLAKTLFIIGLLLPFTPADKWLYSRFTVIFALGGSWLAAWQLYHLSKLDKSKWLDWAKWSFAGALSLWLLASCAITILQNPIRKKLHDQVRSLLPENKDTREDWMLQRADTLLEKAVVWHPHNLASIFLLGAGLFSCSRIAAHRGKSERWAVLAATTTFGEIFLFASTWITFSVKPQTTGLYHIPEWAVELKSEVAEGKVALYSRSDFDYMQLNTPSAYGIRFAEGYDTVTPSRMPPKPSKEWDSALFADVGVSHLLVAPETVAGSLPGWDKVIERKEFILYKNTQFEGLFIVTLSSGERIAVTPSSETPNSMEFDLPPGTENLSLLTSYNPGWSFVTPGKSWEKVDESDQHGMNIVFDPPTQSDPSSVTLRYIPTYRHYYRPLIVSTSAVLLAFSVFGFIRTRRSRLN